MQFKSKKEKTDSVSWKINMVKIGFFVIFILLAYRLFKIQVSQGSYYRDISLRQGVSRGEKSERGNIYFETKDKKLVPAAVNKNGYTLAINPSLIKNEADVYKNLNEIIPLEKESFMEKASKKDDPYEILATRIEKDIAEKIRNIQKNTKGIILVPEKWRYYPAKNLASHILGFVGYDEDKLKGRYGVEKYYDSYLDGKESLSEKSFGSLLDFGQKVFENYESNGASLVLTIEPMLQGVLESNLEKILSDYNGLMAGGLIINPQNGKILAMSAKPDFDPNDFRGVKDVSVFNNPNIGNVFEVGSIFKPLTMAAALDQGAVTSETKYYDKGYVVFNRRKIENYDGKARGTVDMQTVLDKSLNTGAVFAMQALGKDRFLNYIIKYGLNAKTGIDLPGEVRGQIDNLNSKRDIEFATASFGQGIAITPIEFAVAASSLANGGKIIKPHIVDRMILEEDEAELSEQNDKCKIEKCKSGFVLQNETEIKGETIKKETSEKISAMLTKVVDEALLNGTVKMDHYSMAAKTGTAQIIKGGVKGYSENYLHTFFGYAPSFDPQFLVVLFIERPLGVKYASNSLTPPFINIMKFMLNYYEIPPDR